MTSANFAGRQLLLSELETEPTQNVVKIPVIKDGTCHRCGSQNICGLPDGSSYCRDCIIIGRAVSDDYLLRFPAASFSAINNFFSWQGKLTGRQLQVSQQLIANYNKDKPTLVAAVTGAGKTEMLFPLLKHCIKQGARICIAAPRVDVVEELYPRLQQAFAGIKIGKYHGSSSQQIMPLRLTVCSTHQLMKFYHAFDLLIIDEVDSFPFADNRILHFAAKNAVKNTKKMIYLTATPPADLMKEVEHQKLQLLLLNRRFHGGLLPVPEQKLYLRPFISRLKINEHLLRQIKQVMASRHPLLIFVARIRMIATWLQLLRKELPDCKIEGVFAQDPDRLAKVASFRERKIDILLTTTILERGVTFKRVWVLVIAADDPIFSKASLIQIAGRVGRDKDDQQGLVQFCYHRYTEAIRDAIAAIEEMNK